MNTIALLILAWVAPKELIVVAVIALILFGGTRLPQIARLMGKSLTEFKKGLKEAKGEFTSAMSDDDDDDEDKSNSGDKKNAPKDDAKSCCANNDEDQPCEQDYDGGDFDDEDDPKRV